MNIKSARSLHSGFGYVKVVIESENTTVKEELWMPSPEALAFSLDLLGVVYDLNYDDDEIKGMIYLLNGKLEYKMKEEKIKTKKEKPDV